MTTIDSIKELTQVNIAKFGSLVNNDEDVLFIRNDKEIAKVKKNEITSVCFQLMSWSDEIKEDDIFKLKTENAELLFNGHNYLWWKKTEKRLDKFEANLMSKPIEKKERKAKEKIAEPENQYSVGVATLIDGELSDIHYFEGPKSECIAFINQDMLDRYIDETLKAKVVINLAFDEDEFNKIFSDTSSKEEKDAYKKNLEMWYTIQELEEMGAISTK